MSTFILIHLSWFRCTFITYWSQLPLMSHLWLLSASVFIYLSVCLSIIYLSCCIYLDILSTSLLCHGILIYWYNTTLWSQLKTRKYFKRHIKPLMTRTFVSVVVNRTLISLPRNCFMVSCMMLEHVFLSVSLNLILITLNTHS